MRHTTDTFTGLYDTIIFTQQWWPDDTPRAIILLAHGIAEHSGRYAHVAAHLAGQDYAVAALDHRGHGRSQGPRAEVASLDDLADDLRAYFDRLRADYPALPVVLYGHSMGSAVCLLFALRYQDDLAGLITSGTMLSFPLLNRFTRPATQAVMRRLPNLRPLPIPAFALTRDQAVLRAHRSDPLVYRKGLSLGTVSALIDAAQRGAAGLPNLRLPYLALHGGADLLVPRRSADVVRQTCSSPDLTVKVYDGLRHEVHNELGHEQILDDIAGWLNARFEAGAQ